MVFQDLDPEFRQIGEALDRLDRFRERPPGRVRINGLRDAARLLLTPLLPSFAAAYPDIQTEVAVDDRFVDVIAGGFDAGLRYGGTVPEGMVTISSKRITAHPTCDPSGAWLSEDDTAYATLKGFEVMRMTQRRHCARKQPGPTDEIPLGNQLFGLAA